MTLVDANVLLDLVTDDPHWAEWSIAQLEAASLRGPLLINDVIYAEISVRYGRIEEVEGVIEAVGLEIAPMPRPALFLAGKAFTQYRKSDRSRTGLAAGLLHWRPRCRRRVTAADPRHWSLPHLFSVADAYHALKRSPQEARNMSD